MKRLKLILAVAIIPFITSFSQQTKTDNKSTSTKIEGYYFHYTQRCVTCKTVEAQAKENIKTLYGENASFQSVNLDEDSGKALAEKLKVSGQTLLVVKGNSKVNLTNDGFLYARSNPEKFKTIMKTKIDKLK